MFREVADSLLERFAIAWVGFINVDCGKFVQIGKSNSRSRIDQPARRRYDEHAAIPTGRACEGVGIGDLASKIEAAQKSENLGNRGAAFAAQFSREFEVGAFAQNHLRPVSAGIGGRYEKDP